MAMFKKAFEMFLNNRVNPISAKNGRLHMFAVKSPSGNTYTVKIENARATCTCKHGTYGGLCSHIVAVLIWHSFFDYVVDLRERLREERAKMVATKQLDELISKFSKRNDMKETIELLKKRIEEEYTDKIFWGGKNGK